jgi:3-oxoacyl-[acyl-carrier protein] reductase
MMARTVLVTGGSKGIGRAIAARFARAGDAVVITGRGAAALERAAAELGPRVRPVRCDCSDPEELAALVAALPAKVDVLVNNAGSNPYYLRPPPEGLAAVAEAWRFNLENNLLGPVLTTEAVLERIPEGGTVVQIGSTAMEAGASPMAAAKAGLASWNIGLARRLAPLGIVANVVAPGFTADTDYFGGALPDEQRARFAASSPLGRAGTPDEIAGAVWFLASRDARNITGQVIFVNGGSHPTR